MTIQLFVAAIGAICGLAAIAMLLYGRSLVAPLGLEAQFRPIAFLGLVSISALALVIMQAGLGSNLLAGSDGPTFNGSSRQVIGAAKQSSGTSGEDIRKLKAYLNGATVSRAKMSRAPTLPDVDSMIKSLAARLKNDVGDVEGWRMLGWSYRHTDRPKKAIIAYERAVALAPERQDLVDALQEARVAAGRPKSGTPSGGAD